MIGWCSGRQRAQRNGLLAGILVALLVLAVPGGAGAAEEPAKRDDRPARGIGIYTDYSGVVVPLGESVRMDLTVENKGKQDEVVDLKLGQRAEGLEGLAQGRKLHRDGGGGPEREDPEPGLQRRAGQGAGPRDRHLHDRRGDGGREAHGRLSPSR